MSVTQASLLGDTLGNKASGTIPVGGIIMWSGGSVPTGWALCNGNNGTPDLRNRFIVSSGSGYAVGATGGSANAVLVSHSHTATSTVTDNGHAHTLLTRDSTANQGSGQGSNQEFAGGGGAQGSVSTESNSTGITVATSISTEGESATNANLPPYYALAFIMRVS
jgi:microcystin-dependent protein